MACMAAVSAAEEALDMKSLHLAEEGVKNNSI